MKAKLLNQLRNFDNSYEYSDDIYMWRRGRNQEIDLIGLISQINCPFNLDILVKYITKQAIHFYILDNTTNRYYKKEWKGYKNIYQPSENELISKELYNKIEEWFNGRNCL